MSRAGNALKHGLTSRLKREEQSEEARALAEALVGTASATATLREAALELAEALIHHREVGAYRHHTWNEMTSPPEPTELEARRARVMEKARRALAAEGIADPLAGREPPPPTEADNFMLTTAEQLDQIKRLETLSRKALSRRAKAIRQFDYELLEARRAADPEPQASPHQPEGTEIPGSKTSLHEGAADLAAAGECTGGGAPVEEATPGARLQPDAPAALPPHVEALRVSGSDIIAAPAGAAAEPTEIVEAPASAPPPATMAEFIARGEHGPRGLWMEPRWSDDIKAALRPPPLEPGESLTQYIQMFKCYTDPLKLSSLREWLVNQDLTDSKWRQVRREGRTEEPNMQVFVSLHDGSRW